jgi:hypothetical protein
LQARGGTTPGCPLNPNLKEIDMSADKDRGIRRQKQKRAKDQKKQARQQPRPAVAEPGAARKTA